MGPSFVGTADRGGDVAAVEIRGLTKSFVGQVVLDDANLRVRPGEVRGLIGHNGSGKSTLIKALSGYHEPDSGTVIVAGEPLKFGDPVASRLSGLRFIHQDLGLVDELDVLENLKIGTSAYATAAAWRIRWSYERRAARDLLSRFGLDLDPGLPVSRLSPVQRTKLAIARALQDPDAVRMLVLDEPTATLPHSEVEQLFELVRTAAARGVGILYVSHRLEELYELCDTVTVLRDGRVVADAPMAEIDRPSLVRLVVGDAGIVPADPSGEEEEAPEAGGPVLLRARGLSGAQLDGLNLEVRAGEIVGLAGLAGSGVHEFSRMLLGETPVEHGGFAVDGEQADSPSPRYLRDRGVAVLPSTKLLKSIPTMTVRENLTLPDLRPMWRRGMFRAKVERQIAAQLIADYDVRPAEGERMMATLSGGNQQKACVARWMRTQPRVFVLDEPTAGVDVGGRSQILRFLRDASRDGVALVLCSSDLDDLAEICTRVVVVRGGRNGTELRGKAITRERIAAECYA